MDDDREQILAWRNSDRVRLSMLDDSSISAAVHREWFSRIHGDSRCIYRVFIYAGRPVGLVYFVDINWDHRTCNWGFYIGEEGLPRGLGTIMGCLALDMVFREYGLRRVAAKVIAGNLASLRLHRKLGFIQEEDGLGKERDTTETRGMVHLVMDVVAWDNVKRGLDECKSWRKDTTT